MECTESFDLPSPYPSMINQIRGGTIREEVEPTPKAKPAPKEKPPAAAPKAKREADMISVGEIASQMGIEASTARSALRKTNTPKPPHGWAWQLDQVDSIKATIKRGLK